jgi:thymidylate synthase (FAD)
MTHSSNGQITVTYKDVMGDDLTVVNAARVSFGKESKALGWYGPDARPLIPVLSQPDINLINYLAKHKHMSPFGHAFASFHVKAPIFVARQLVKHKFIRWNEISRRYTTENIDFYVPDVWRGRSADKKQGSEGAVELGFFSTMGGRFEGYFGEGTLAEAVSEYPKDVLGLYESLILVGVAPEQARMILPQSTMTEWWWSGSLDAFADMCKLRLKDDTQYETRLVAQMIDKEMSHMFPVSWAALVKGDTDA